MQFIINFISGLVDFSLGLAWQIYNTIHSLWDNYIDPNIDQIVESIPDLSNFWSNLEVVQPYTAFANMIIPLDTVSSFIGYYLIFITTFLGVRTIWHLIRG